MHVLVSTTATQGDRPGDFCWVPEGELVGRYGVVCASEGPGRTGCGCGRSFGGFVTHRATSTAVVAEADLTGREWREAATAILRATGYAEYMTTAELVECVAEMERDDIEPIQSLPVGTVIGRCAWPEPLPYGHPLRGLLLHDHLVVRGPDEVVATFGEPFACGEANSGQGRAR